MLAAIDYVVDVVEKINNKPLSDSALLPKGSGLSINYPPLPKAQIKGVHFVENEMFPTPQISYDILPDGTAKQTINPASLNNVQDDTDSGWLNKGYITYTLIDGAWNAPQYQAQYEKALRK